MGVVIRRGNKRQKLNKFKFPTRKKGKERVVSIPLKWQSVS